MQNSPEDISPQHYGLEKNVPRLKRVENDGATSGLEGFSISQTSSHLSQRGQGFVFVDGQV